VFDAKRQVRSYDADLNRRARRFQGPQLFQFSSNLSRRLTGNSVNFIRNSRR